MQLIKSSNQLKKDKDIFMEHIKKGYKMATDRMSNIELLEVNSDQFYEIAIIIKCNRELDPLSKLDINGLITIMLDGDTKCIRNIDVSEVRDIKRKSYLMKNN